MVTYEDCVIVLVKACQGFTEALTASQNNAKLTGT